MPLTEKEKPCLDCLRKLKDDPSWEDNYPNEEEIARAEAIMSEVDTSIPLYAFPMAECGVQLEPDLYGTPDVEICIEGRSVSVTIFWLNGDTTPSEVAGVIEALVGCLKKNKERTTK